MNSSQRSARRNAWVRVYQHEMSRRKRVLKEKGHKAYLAAFADNPKPFRDDCKAGGHIWTPATNVHIHDTERGKNVYVIQGVYTRAFSEALPYTFENYQICPQICWYCEAYREDVREKVSWSERKTLKEKIVSDRNGKKRGRKGSGPDITSIDELFDNEVGV